MTLLSIFTLIDIRELEFIKINRGTVHFDSPFLYSIRFYHAEFITTSSPYPPLSF